MEASERREKLFENLQVAKKPVSGSKLANELGVSRQVIVQDIAILRAGGIEVLATPQGYVLSTKIMGRPRRIFACQHTGEQIEEELKLIIQLGGKVIDVIVEHPIYGELRGLLMLGSISELEEYINKCKITKAEPLSLLTNGIHLHTIEAEKEEYLVAIGEILKKKGFLLCEV